MTKKTRKSKTSCVTSKRTFRVTDPKACYPVFAVEVIASNQAEAAARGAEAMLGTLDNIDDRMLQEFLRDLDVIEVIDPPAVTIHDVMELIGERWQEGDVVEVVTCFFQNGQKLPRAKCGFYPVDLGDGDVIECVVTYEVTSGNPDGDAIAAAAADWFRIHR